MLFALGLSALLTARTAYLLKAVRTVDGTCTAAASCHGSIEIGRQHAELHMLYIGILPQQPCQVIVA